MIRMYVHTWCTFCSMRWQTSLPTPLTEWVTSSVMICRLESPLTRSRNCCSYIDLRWKVRQRGCDGGRHCCAAGDILMVTDWRRGRAGGWTGGDSHGANIDCVTPHIRVMDNETKTHLISRWQIDVSSVSCSAYTLGIKLIHPENGGFLKALLKFWAPYIKPWWSEKWIFNINLQRKCMNRIDDSHEMSLQ